MALSTIWVLAEAADGKPLPVSLELLSKARDLADTVEAVAWGTDTAAIAPALGAHGASKVHDVGDLGGALPGAPVAAAVAAAVRAAPPPPRS
jgi:electron transfer flavoprotein alpha subunit